MSTQMLLNLSKFSSLWVRFSSNISIPHRWKSGSALYQKLLIEPQLPSIFETNKKACSSNAGSIKFSYAHGTSDVPLIGQTIGQLLTQVASDYSQRDAVVFPSQNMRLNFKELYEQSLQVAANLLALGLKKGDRVGVWGPNRWEWVVAQYATSLAGFILVNVNPLYTCSELAFTSRLVGIKALVVADRWQKQDYVGMLEELCPQLVRHGQPDPNLPELQHIVVMGKSSHSGISPFEQLLEAKADVEPVHRLQDALQFDDPINIQFTSGTTGRPKGAVLSHHNIVNNSYMVGLVMDYHQRRSVICNPVPLYHCFGMVLGCMQTITHGATVVFPSESFEAEVTLKAVQDERCTSLYGVPTMFIDMLNSSNLEQYDLTSLYTGIMAGSSCPAEVMQNVVDRLHMPEVTICYGTTENSPVTFQTHRHHPLDKRVSTIGTAHAHTEVKVIDSEGQILPTGVAGELCIRGYCVMREYWQQPDKTQEVIGEDRWYRTGDLAILHEDGFAQIVGRLKDVIIRGGENVYPAEVEEVLHQHPAVKDVQVVGVPHERLGEEICACVKLVDGHELSQQELKDFCKDKIARFKIPRHLVVVEDFPLTVSGKVQKFLLRDEAVQRLNVAA